MLLAFLMLHCAPETSTGEEDYTLLTIDVNGEDSLLTSQIYDDITYIPLETTEECILGEINKIISVEEFIFILDSEVNEALFTFSNDGTYFDKIDKLGPGPGEYLSIDDFCVDTVNQELVILSSSSEKCLIFSYEGEFLQEIPFNLYAYKIEMTDDGHYLLFCMNEPNPEIDNPHFFKLSRSGEIMDTYFPIREKEKDIHHQLVNQVISSEEGTFYLPSFIPEIYQFTGEGFAKKYEVSFGSQSLDLEQYPSFSSSDILYEIDRNAYAIVDGHLIDTGNWLFFTMVYQGQIGYVYYHKDREELRWSYSVLNYKDMFPLFPPLTSKSNTHIGAILPQYLHDFHEALGSASGETLTELVAKTTRTSNPVLYFANLL